jgi:dihydroorotate dehydrogenase electron transfer subunit
MGRQDRNSIFVETAEVLANDAFSGEQYVLRVHAPRLAAAANPGSFAHIQ